MRVKILFIFFLMISAAKAQTTKHVILISIDGLHPDMYLDRSWPAPNLRELVKKGTYADHMLSVFPSYTYPSHVAMLTGAMPARSGISFNQPKNNRGEWNWFANAIRTPTLWRALKAKHMTTAAVEWPVSVTSDITWNIPEIWSNQYPDRITESSKYATPGLISEIEKYATGKLDSINMSEEYLSMDANSARAAAYIFKQYRPALLAVHFAEVDGYEHSYGRDADHVRLALAAVDCNVGVILEAIKRSNLQDSTAVIIVGDHGFSTIHTLFRPNMLIENVNGAFVTAGGSAFLYRFSNTNANEVPDIAKSVTDSLDKLPKEKRNMFRIIYREQLDKMGVDSSAILALAAVPGLVFSASTPPTQTSNLGSGAGVKNQNFEGVFIPATGGHHGYDPNLPDMYTGFIAYGAGIVKGGHVKNLCVTDIAPLVAQLLKIEFKTPDGKLVSGIMISN